MLTTSDGGAPAGVVTDLQEALAWLNNQHTHYRCHLAATISAHIKALESQVQRYEVGLSEIAISLRDFRSSPASPSPAAEGVRDE